jgi:hypothetical protein
MSTTPLLSIGNSDATSGSFTVIAGTPQNVSLDTGSDGPPAPLAEVAIEQQGSGGHWHRVGTLNAIMSAGSISAPGTYRAHRFAIGNVSVGVDLSS